jgi:polyhydroxyalkanoate synthesis regulator phasin
MAWDAKARESTDKLKKEIEDLKKRLTKLENKVNSHHP